jgi:hypothetical protein
MAAGATERTRDHIADQKRTFCVDCIAAFATQCRSNPVSGRDLPKTEFFKYLPETIGYFALQAAEFGA